MRRLSQVAGFAGYAVATAITNLWRHPTQSASAIFAMVVMLVVLNGFLIVVGNMTMATDALEQKVNLIAYLRDDAPPSAGPIITDRIERARGVIEVRFVSKEDAMARLREDLADRADLIDMISGNPLPASVEVRVNDVTQLREFAASLRTDPDVEEVILPEDAIDNLVRLARATRVGGAIVIFGFALVTTLVVGNVIRLAVFARRHEIELMRLVGATDWFVRWPFLLEGVLYGAIGATVTSGIVVGSLPWVEGATRDVLRFLPMTTDPLLPVRLSAVSAGVGLAVGAAGSFLSVRRFLDA
jgi:cell division transport system permease protein